MPSKKKSVRARDYDVGYGKPPKGSQYKRGQSGNAGGRPPNVPPPRPKEGEMLPFDVAILRAMRGKVEVKSGRKTRKVNTFDAIVGTLLARAVEGDMRAIREVLDLYRAAEAREAQIEAQLNSQGSVQLTLMLAKLMRKGYARQDGDCEEPLVLGSAGLKSPLNPEQLELELEPASSELTAADASGCDWAADCCAAEGSLNDAAPEMITPMPEVHSPPPPPPKLEAPAPPVKPAALAFQPRRRGDPLIANRAPIVGVGWGVSGHGPPPPLR